MNTPPDRDLVYLDYNATTPLDPRVAAKMASLLESVYGNPSSSHRQGRAAKREIEAARTAAADLLGCRHDEIVFTSGGTEANNHALIGAARAHAARGRHLVTSAVEHPAVSEVLRFLETEGFSVTTVPVDSTGRVDADRITEAFTDETILVSVMHANNEVGTLQPVAEIAESARARGILTHSDCAQSVGKVPVRLDELGVDLLSVAGHKLYAPKGVGLLCVRDGVELDNLMFGAGHERGRRPGTENTLQIAALGEACRLAAEDLEAEIPRLTRLRGRLEAELTAACPGSEVHGHRELRLPNTLSMGFPGVTAQDLMAAVPHVAVSAGAACHGDRVVVSHVLAAMGVSPDMARGTLRLSVGRMTTEEEIDLAAAAFAAAYAELHG